MKAKKKITFHNRFDIEVRNKDTGELKQKGVAENIVLNQMYTRLCNFQSYFINIHFGTGAGTPTPDRTTLFSHLGTKTATTEEIIKAVPTSKWTRKISLNPEEFVGQPITEVGIAFGSTSSNLVTHAMIKDAEGNPLSILKTELDVIIIYATVFINIQNGNDLSFIKMPNANDLLNYLTGTATSYASRGLFLDSEIGTEMSESSINNGSALSLAVSNNVAEKKIIYSGRVPVNTNLNDVNTIKTLALSGILKASFPGNNYLRYPFAGQVLGLGDGIKRTFYLPHGETKNEVICVDGVVVSNYAIEGTYKSGVGYSWETIAETVPPGEDLGLNYKIGEGSRATGGVLRKKIPLKNGDLKLFAKANTVTSGLSMYLEGSHDGVLWVSLSSVKPTQAHTLMEVPIPATFWDFEYIRLANSGYSGSGILVPGFSGDLLRRVVFDNPPDSGVVITANYEVEYIPKDSDHVLDVSFSIQFGEEV